MLAGWLEFFVHGRAKKTLKETLKDVSARPLTRAFRSPRRQFGTAAVQDRFLLRARYRRAHTKPQRHEENQRIIKHFVPSCEPCHLQPSSPLAAAAYLPSQPLVSTCFSAWIFFTSVRRFPFMAPIPSSLRTAGHPLSDVSLSTFSKSGHRLLLYETPLSPIQSPLRGVPGNHERASRMAEAMVGLLLSVPNHRISFREISLGSFARQCHSGGLIRIVGIAYDACLSDRRQRKRTGCPA